MIRSAILSKNRNRQKFLKCSEQAKKRQDLKKNRRSIMSDMSLSLHEKIKKNLAITHQMDKLKRDSSPCRVRNMCGICGRPRFFIRDMNMCRICVRHYADRIVGLQKDEKSKGVRSGVRTSELTMSTKPVFHKKQKPKANKEV